ncbi:4'-phosphopantetheinyl transferase family protein [Kribbella sp. WER1]
MASQVHLRLARGGTTPRPTAHALLLELASTLVDDPVLTHDATGRPHVPNLAVSISYSHQLVAVAASYDGPLGIDLEEVRPREFDPIANHWFAPQELEWMEDQPDRLRAFLQLWTAKEAVGKALGTGLEDGGLRRPTPPGLTVLHLPEAEPAILAVALPSTGAVARCVTDS